MVPFKFEKKKASFCDTPSAITKNVIPLKLTRCQECPGSGKYGPLPPSLPPTNPTLILTSHLEQVVAGGGGGGG